MIVAYAVRAVRRLRYSPDFQATSKIEASYGFTGISYHHQIDSGQ